ncbi:hypothetical protein FGO68_gene2966 [Halteria grandinella]|uniref:Uncharacterized protein n=1 Tax=Halteria grandinella TaxID=5974 RepID=A0A8J8NSY1_HALGN|nr:hypothetical protein FGO68_gene2966 [Halteria grandinella]
MSQKLLKTLSTIFIPYCRINQKFESAYTTLEQFANLGLDQISPLKKRSVTQMSVDVKEQLSKNHTRGIIQIKAQRKMPEIRDMSSSNKVKIIIHKGARHLLQKQNALPIYTAPNK